MKREREPELPPWKPPRDFELARYYFQNGNIVLAAYSYNKWYDSLTYDQREYIQETVKSKQINVWGIAWRLDAVAEDKMLGREERMSDVANVKEHLEEIAAVDYRHVDF